MRDAAEKYLRLTFLFVMGTLVAGVIIVPLLLGVWLPDVVIDRVHTLAQARSSGGHSFRVIQYWNHGDFYNTELIHTAPNGTTNTQVLDGDDSKTWRVPLKLDERTRLVTVTLSGGRTKIVEW